MAEVVAYEEKHTHPTISDYTVAELFEQERKQLRPLATPFSGYVEQEVRVSSTCLIHFDSNHYSVDSQYANHHVTLRIYAQRIEIHAEQLLATHSRLFGRDKTSYPPWHYLGILERKPGALRNGAPFQQWELPASIRKVQQPVVSAPLILNKLQRLREPSPPAPIKNNVIPLHTSPRADCNRYNRLLANGGEHGEK